MDASVLHITDGDRKFIPQLIAFFGERFTPGSQEFVVMSRDPARALDGVPFVHARDLLAARKLARRARDFDVIVLHGLTDFYVVLALRLSGIDASKCHWAIWGGDIHCYLKKAGTLRRRFRNAVRRSFVKRLGHVLSLVDGDVEKARNWYGFRGEHHECFMYLSNTAPKELPAVPEKSGDAWDVLVGNSGYDSNEHLAVFDRIVEQVGDEVGRVICPLSYGTDRYIERVVERGRACFGERFVPLLDFLPFDEYLTILAGVDAAIFAHRHQQGLGNMIPLLGMGKKVFLRTDVPQWHTFAKLGITAFDCERLSTGRMDDATRDANVRISREYFSAENLARQYRAFFASATASRA